MIQESDITPSIATAKGHLGQERRILQLTEAQGNETASIMH